MKTAVNFVLKAFPAPSAPLSRLFHIVSAPDAQKEVTDDGVNSAHLLPFGPDLMALLRE